MYSNRFRDWNFPINPVRREDKIIELYALVSDSGAQVEVPDLSGRRKIAKALNAISDRLGNANYDSSTFMSGRALDYPTIPGEELRNLSELRKTQERLE